MAVAQSQPNAPAGPTANAANESGAAPSARTAPVALPQRPARIASIDDGAALLAPERRQALETRLAEAARAHDLPAFIVTVPSLGAFASEGDALSADAFAQTLFRRWLLPPSNLGGSISSLMSVPRPPASTSPSTSTSTASSTTASTSSSPPVQNPLAAPRNPLAPREPQGDAANAEARPEGASSTPPSEASPAPPPAPAASGSSFSPERFARRGLLVVIATNDEKVATAVGSDWLSRREDLFAMRSLLARELESGDPESAIEEAISSIEHLATGRNVRRPGDTATAVILGLFAVLGLLAAISCLRQGAEGLAWRIGSAVFSALGRVLSSVVGGGVRLTSALYGGPYRDEGRGRIVIGEW
ncbi:MAG TPA: TPM domain-containing protein [Planctomycetota bacterium]|nr:TPM domain-containing protein [Planctomycetota bacterium]